jgi:hypothetical protein
LPGRFCGDPERLSDFFGTVSKEGQTNWQTYVNISDAQGKLSILVATTS